MRSINVLGISKSPLIQEFTKEVFESYYDIGFAVPKKYVIDTNIVPAVSPNAFKRSLMENAVSTTEPVAGEKIYYVEGKPRAVNGMLKIKNLLNDPSVSRIECQGPNTPLILLRRGMKQFARISLTKEEIFDILDDFTEKSHIPLVEGVVHVVVDNFEISGIYSELIRSSFSVSRI
ncbi:hypothetical protein CMI41_03355 [Candidatus Pacearchaeota archaeon]|nr:hypothetical protein [Candidatus Pacearchaeota archaeon]|tara:strand:- start:6413 stop:6940 length:528 start_codon:yes stop_codon:yes gene_type:complete